MNRRSWCAVATLALAAALLPIGGPAAAVPTTAAAAAPSAPAQVTFRTMTFNIEEGGTHVSFAKVVEAIRAAHADVVTVDEAFGNTRKLAKALGWKYAAPRLSIVSRLPLLDPAGADGYYVYVQPAPGTVVAISNVHLPSWPGNTDLILKGKKPSKILKIERETRLPAVTPTLARLRTQVARGIPALLQGDMNAPSYQDWTAATVGTFPQIKWPLAWPVSRAIAAGGFVDAYRATHPDPVSAPGITWPAGRPKLKGAWNPPKNAPQDRLDQIWFGGQGSVTRSAVVGEPGHADITVSPWPSDHRAVVAELAVDAVPTPVTVSVLRPLTAVGKRVSIVARTDGSAGARVLVLPQGRDAGRDVGPRPSSARASAPLAAVDADQTVRIPARRLGPGAFDAVLVDAYGVELARTPFWVEARGAKPAVRVGAAKRRWVEVSWRGAPGNQWDWIGIYRRGAADPSADSYLNWAHTGGLTAGTMRLGARDDGDDSLPLSPGRYVAVLLADDGYTTLARARFTVGR